MGGALVAYNLVHGVGRLLDKFQVRWWAAHATLLGTLRNGGLLPQECDVDIALWRPDSHWLVRPEFRAAVAAAGIAIMQAPSYMVFRFCMAYVPPEGDSRSVDGFTSCRE